jgi:4-hydroxybenzoate polyprenyltransferase
MTLSVCKVLTGGADYTGSFGCIVTRITALYDFLIFSALLLSFECVAMAYVSCAIQQLSWTPTVAAIAFLAAFSIYNLNRKTDEAEDAINQKERFAFTKRYEKVLFWGSVLAFFLALALSARAGILGVLATAAPFIFGFLYSFRWLPQSCRYHRLKEIPGVKNCVVGLAWGVLLSLLPVYLNNSVPDMRTLVTFVLFFLWGFMASLIPDIRDLDGDAASGVMTIPVLFGRGQTKIILTSALLLLGMPLIFYSLVALPVFTTFLLTASALYSLMCICLLEKPAIINFLADAVSDGQYIAFAAGLVIFPALWH